MKTLTLFILLLFPTLVFCQNGLTGYAVPTGSPTTYRNDLKVDAGDNVWVAFRDIGLGKFDGTNWTVFNNSNSAFPDTTCYAIAFTGNDAWAGSNKGLAKYDGTNWTVFNTFNSAIPSDTVKSLLSIGTNLWVGTTKGAAYFDGLIWTIYNSSNSGIISDSVSAFAVGGNGEIWMGTNSGLSKFYQNVWTNYNSSNSGLSQQKVISLVVDNNNDVWMGSYIGPIYKMEGGVIKNFITEIYSGAVPFMFSNNAGLIKDLNGKIISVQSSGLAKIYSNSADLFYFGRSIYGTTFLGYKNDFDSNGKLWIVAKRGNLNDSIYSFDINLYSNFGLGLTNENFKNLDINNVKAAMLNQGDMHWDLSNSKYEVPKGSGKTSVFSSSLWIGGLDQAGQLHMAAMTYRQTGIDFWPGPIDTLTGIADTPSVLPYDRIWKVDRFKIEEFKYNYQLGNVQNGTYIVPKDIAEWPAIGMGNITRDLAPYVDFNGDGMYNYMDGDYPLIKGDQMLYWIFNDNLSSHTETGGLPLGFEIHASAYAFTCPNIADSNAVLNTTTLYNYKIINRGNNSYDSLFIGLWCDVDLGDATDDYVGCDTVLNAGFGYNGDNDDGTVVGYGLNPPMQNVQILQGPIADIGDGIDNNHDGTTDEFGERCMMNCFHTYWNDINACGNPIGAVWFYYFISSRYGNGSHFMYGNYCNGGTIPTDFMFSGTPYDPSGWTEFTSLNVPSDRRFVESSGPFSLAAGQETSIDFAYVWTRDTTGPNGLTTSIARNTADLQRIKSWFDNDNFPSCLPLNVGINENASNDFTFSIHPNPANDILYVNTSKSHSQTNYMITDLLGKTISEGKLSNNSINIRMLPRGLYILTVNNNGKEARKKFVKY